MRYLPVCVAGHNTWETAEMEGYTPFGLFFTYFAADGQTDLEQIWMRTGMLGYCNRGERYGFYCLCGSKTFNKDGSEFHLNMLNEETNNNPLYQSKEFET